MSMVVPMNGFSSGANPLNFKVVGNPQPANPKENTIWVNTSTKVTSWDFSASEPHRRSGNKNLIVYPYLETTITRNGITFTDNKNGTITVSGTANANTIFYVASKGQPDGEILLEPGTYTLSQGQNRNGWALIMFYSYDNWKTETQFNTNVNESKKSIVLDKPARVRVTIWVASGTTISGVKISPQLEKGSVATSFVKGDATGQVWIETGTSSPVAFNALKKNGIEVYPISASQYISGAWVDKTAKTYQGGAWVNWMRMLFNNGNQYADITGGWIGYTANTAGSNQVCPTITIKDGVLTATMSNVSNNRHGIVATSKAIDVTRDKTLHFTIVESNCDDNDTDNDYTGKQCIGVFSIKGGTATVMAKQSLRNSDSGKEFNIDISQLSGSYFVGLQLTRVASGTAYMKINNVYLE